LKDLGKHPVSNASVVIKSGRYGPYVTDGVVNASLQQGADPDALTMTEAVLLLEARAAKAPTKGRRRAAAPKAAKKAAPKKAAAATKAPKDPAAPKAKAATKKKASKSKTA
jgi:DNA topoisomerase-1